MPSNSKDYQREYMKRYASDKLKGGAVVTCDVCDKTYKKYCKSKHNATKYHQSFKDKSDSESEKSIGHNFSTADISKIKKFIDSLEGE